MRNRIFVVSRFLLVVVEQQQQQQLLLLLLLLLLVVVVVVVLFTYSYQSGLLAIVIKEEFRIIRFYNAGVYREKRRPVPYHSTQNTQHRKSRKEKKDIEKRKTFMIILCSLRYQLILIPSYIYAHTLKKSKRENNVKYSKLHVGEKEREIERERGDDKKDENDERALKVNLLNAIVSRRKALITNVKMLKPCKMMSNLKTFDFENVLINFFFCNISRYH